MPFIEELKSIDHQLLLSVNGWAGGNAAVDQFMLFLSMKYVWIPMYGLILYFLWKRYGWSVIPYLLVSVFALVLLTDQGSVQLFKESFKRYRPCHNDEISTQLNLLGRSCGGKYGFISSHASNVFGIASFILTLRPKPQWGVLFVWAFLVSFSRIYLGVHYPADVAVGAIYGSFIGLLVGISLTKAIVR